MGYIQAAKAPELEHQPHANVLPPQIWTSLSSSSSSSSYTPAPTWPSLSSSSSASSCTTPAKTTVADDVKLFLQADNILGMQTVEELDSAIKQILVQNHNIIQGTNFGDLSLKLKEAIHYFRAISHQPPANGQQKLLTAITMPYKAKFALQYKQIFLLSLQQAVRIATEKAASRLAQLKSCLERVLQLPGLTLFDFIDPQTFLKYRSEAGLSNADIHPDTSLLDLLDLRDPRTCKMNPLIITMTLDKIEKNVAELRHQKEILLQRQAKIQLREQLKKERAAYEARLKQQKDQYDQALKAMQSELCTKFCSSIKEAAEQVQSKAQQFAEQKDNK
jgi:hypothetical protein